MIPGLLMRMCCAKMRLKRTRHAEGRLPAAPLWDGGETGSAGRVKMPGHNVTEVNATVASPSSKLSILRGRSGEGRKPFFFEKKNQKTFMSLD
jgi:hypothetical protein